MHTKKWKLNHFYNFIERFLLKDKDMNWPNLHENERNSSKQEFFTPAPVYSTICFGLGVIDPTRPMALLNFTFFGAISSMVRFRETNLMTLTSVGRSAHVSVP